MTLIGKNLAIIPARGGSKRIPRKNIKLFIGKPIIAYSIEAAIKTNLFDVVMVSTDDTEIANISKEFGAKVPFLRTKKNADDHAGIADVILEVIKEFSKNNIFFENVCCILATAPLIKQEDIILAYEKLTNENLDSIIPVVKYNYPIQRALKIVNGKVSLIWPENLMKRSQDLDSSYYDAALFYWMKTSSFLSRKTILSENSSALIVNDEYIQDIDTDNDWIKAEKKYIELFKINK